MIGVAVAVVAALAGALSVGLGTALYFWAGYEADDGSALFGLLLLLFSVGVIAGSLAGLLVLRYALPDAAPERLLRLSVVAVVSAALACGALFVTYSLVG